MPTPAPENSIHPNSRAEWRSWLSENHQRDQGIWMITYKKATGKSRVDYDAAVEEALCFGWIDSKPNKLDEERSLLWFAPRKPKMPFPDPLNGGSWSGSARLNDLRPTTNGSRRPLDWPMKISVPINGKAGSSIVDHIQIQWPEGQQITIKSPRSCQLIHIPYPRVDLTSRLG